MQLDVAAIGYSRLHEDKCGILSHHAGRDAARREVEMFYLRLHMRDSVNLQETTCYFPKH
jgi:hypothetical protein